MMKKQKVRESTEKNDQRTIKRGEPEISLPVISSDSEKSHVAGDPSAFRLRCCAASDGQGGVRGDKEGKILRSSGTPRKNDLSPDFAMARSRSISLIRRESPYNAGTKE